MRWKICWVSASARRAYRNEETGALAEITKPGWLCTSLPPAARAGQQHQGHKQPASGAQPPESLSRSHLWWYALVLALLAALAESALASRYLATPREEPAE